MAMRQTKHSPKSQITPNKYSISELTLRKTARKTKTQARQELTKYPLLVVDVENGMVYMLILSHMIKGTQYGPEHAAVKKEKRI